MTTIKPPDKPRTRVSGRESGNSDTSELMRHLLTDIPDNDRRHLVDVVDRNHAEQLARKRRARAEPMADETADNEADEGDDY